MIKRSGNDQGASTSGVEVWLRFWRACPLHDAPDAVSLGASQPEMVFKSLSYRRLQSNG